MPSHDNRQTVNAAIQELYPRVKRFFRNRIPEPDCYDEAQETIRAFLSARAEQIANPRAYLWGIANMRFLKYISRRRPTEQFDSAVLTITQFQTSLSVRVARRSRLQAALHGLPLDHQTAFELRYAEELALEDVAAALGKSLATTKRYIKDAKAMLAEHLGAGSELTGAEMQQLIDVCLER